MKVKPRDKFMIGFTAPHFAASEAGQNILKQGGSAVEAMVAAAATIAVVYPHMNGLGGDGFWLISEPGKQPVAIDASGCAAANATPAFYNSTSEKLTSIPSRGSKAALTMAGAVEGWQKALQVSHAWQPTMPLADLLHNAITHAKSGITVTQSLQDASEKTFNDFKDYSAFEVFRNNQKCLTKGQTLKLPKLAESLSHLSNNGLDDFYHGDIARSLASDLTQAGSPIQLSDFNDYKATLVEPLSVNTSAAQLYNLPAPTQGLASLMILALYDRVRHQAKSKQDSVHLIVECTKQAFIVRNQTIADPSRLQQAQSDFLQDELLDSLAAKISLKSALPWPHAALHGDTIWMGACDSKGRMVSYIQSLYWEFGSGIVSPQTGIVWNNRGTSFSLLKDSLQYLQPGLKPFHTLNPAYAEFHNGERMVYGTMGGEGQPQTQATLFSRYVWGSDTSSRDDLVTAISQPRWLLGRTWGDVSHNLKIESDMDPMIISSLKKRGHDVALVAKQSEMMGHAGAVHLDKQGAVTSATDPRSDGKAFAESGSSDAAFTDNAFTDNAVTDKPVTDIKGASS